MASLQTASFMPGHAHSRSAGKITKSRGTKAVTVKPLLKKFHSHSEKNSLDLDRSWDDQSPAVAYTLLGSNTRDSHDASTPGLGPLRPTGTSLDYGSRAGRDIISGFAADDLLSRGYGSISVGGEGSLPGSSLKYAHARTASGTSHVSTATSGSGRNGHFVHPFQQTPLTSTTPLSHPFTSSRASLDTATPGARDYSPIITENEKEQEESPGSISYFPSNTTPIVGTSKSYRSPVLPHSFSQSDSHRSSANNSMSDVTQLPRATAASARPALAPTSRSASAAAAISHSNRSDLGKITSLAPGESIASSMVPVGTSPSTLATTSSSASTTATTPMSPIRSSLDMSGFRLRSRSELDTATRQEHVRQARRKFEEKERAKEEKFAREQVRKRERADNKEAQRFERAHAHGRKSSSFSNGMSSTRDSINLEQRSTSAAGPRKSFARQRTASYGGAGSRLGVDEKGDFGARDYGETASEESPRARTEDVHFQTTRRTTTKRKTTGAWTAFVLWLRTRLFKMGRR